MRDRLNSPAPVSSGFFALRTPLLPFDEYEAWSHGLEAPGMVGTADLHAALERDRVLLRRRLRQIVARGEVREAIFVASPTADEMIDTWLANPEDERAAECERALVRYLARMTGRSTPFGLFAGVSLGIVGSETQLSLGGRQRNRRATRLDAGYLARVVEGLLATAEQREQQIYYPNPTLYRAGERRRYVRSQPSAAEGRHRLVSVRDTAALAAALGLATEGATTVQLVAAVAATGATDDGASRYVGDLIEQRLLVSTIDVLVTGGDALYGLAEAFGGPLAQVKVELATLDGCGPPTPPGRYREIAALLEPLPAKLDINEFVQVDMAKETEAATLGRDVVGEILRAAELLRRIGRSNDDGGLVRFIERFTERFEGEAVPLLEALDPDFGVPFDDDDPAPSPLLAGLDAGGGGLPGASWGTREDHLLARVLEVQAAGGHELVLTQRDVEKLERADADALPDAWAAMAVVAAPTEADLAHGNFRVLLLGIDGPSGARLLGRFCHNDPALEAAVEQHLRAEEALDADAIFAEIVHLPRSRDVNVVARPVLREYEIPCLGKSGAPLERQIPLGDLQVSVEAGRVVLRSRRLGRRVVPRLTSAHNFSSRGVAAYRFLCRLQNQQAATGLGFWGPLGSSPFLPRVRMGRIILSSARWRLKSETLGERGDRTADFKAIQDWRRTWRVPRFIAQTDFGGQLPVDLDNALAVESLVDAVRSTGVAELVELFPAPGESCVRGPEGAFMHELVVPFVRPATAPGEPPRRAATSAPVRRVFPPGSDWLSVRIYTGEALADAVLTDTIAPLAERLMGSGAADRWFFLRYQDPRYHLRVRFHGERARLQAEVLSAIQGAGERLIDDGLAWRVDFGTYRREIERYGGAEAMELVETVFHADSDAVCDILGLLDHGDAGQVERWQMGVAGTDALLTDLGLSDAEKLDLVRRQRTGLARRVGWDAAALGRVGARHRKERVELEALLGAGPDSGHPLEPGLEILRERSRRLKTTMEALQDHDHAGRLTLSRPEIASSLLHMYLNRLLRGNNVAQELVICDFLGRLYEAQAKRGAG